MLLFMGSFPLFHVPNILHKKSCFLENPFFFFYIEKTRQLHDVKLACFVPKLQNYFAAAYNSATLSQFTTFQNAAM